MDGRSITSKYDFSESDSESIHSGQGRTARTVSFVRRYASSASQLTSRKEDSKMDGFAVRSATSVMILRENGEVSEPAEPRPRTSYMFSLGKEQDGVMEIIPKTPPNDCNSDAELDFQIIPATPSGQDDSDGTPTAGGVSFEQWRHSALLPVPPNHLAVRSGTRASSVYSQHVGGSEDIDDCASSTYSQESCGTTRTRTMVPGQLVMRTRSLLSLARKYAALDNISIYSRVESEDMSSTLPVEEDDSLRDDTSSIYSRDERADPVQPQTRTRAGTMDSAQSLPTPRRNSWKLLPSLRGKRTQQTWLSPPSSHGPPKDTIPDSWSRDPPGHLNHMTWSAMIRSEVSSRSCSQEPTLRRRPSSWSWLSVDTTPDDEAASIGTRNSLEPTILRGQRYLQKLSRPASVTSEPATESQFPAYATSLPPRYSRIFARSRRSTTGSRPEDAACVAPRRPPIEDRRDQRQDPLELPPLQLPELPDEQRLSFYIRCGHLEDNWLFETGPELPGWCPQCSRGRRGKRKVVKRELKSMLKSIAE
jgi:hypothetical protein